MIQSQFEKKIALGDEWQNDAQVLSVKLYRHIASAQLVSQKTTFRIGKTQSTTHVDHSSVAIIVRAAIETFLAFHYIFTSKDVNTVIFRHNVWKHAGLIDRSKILASTKESKRVIQDEAILIEELKNEIITSGHYHDCNRDAKKAILSGEWKPKGGWYTIIKQTEIHPRYFNDIYSHTSGHSHTSYISAIQIRDAWQINDQQMLADSIRQTLRLILSHFVFLYSELFPESRQVLECSPKLFELAETWHIHKKDVAHIYGPY
jgi:hypothetical protein